MQSGVAEETAGYKRAWDEANKLASTLKIFVFFPRNIHMPYRIHYCV